MRRNPIGPAGALLLLLASAGPLLAHGEAVLKSERSSTSAGETLSIQGAEFEPGEKYALKLTGAMRGYPLRDVQAGADGTFQLDLTVPADVAAGTYKLEAVAPDGDVVARLDVTVLVAAPVPGQESTEHQPPPSATAGMESMPHGEMAIARSRSGIGWGVIGLLVGFAAGLGAGLLTVRRYGPPSETGSPTAAEPSHA